MAFRSLGLLTLLLLQWRNINGKVKPEIVAIEDLKDLMLTSMQNTVSLNDLVTKLTQKIVDIMLKLGDTKAGMEQMEQTLSTEIDGLKNETTSIKAKTDTDIENVKEALAGVKETLAGVKEALAGEIEGLKNETTSIKAKTDTDIENVKEALAGVTNNVESLGSDIQELKEDVLEASREVTIVSSEGTAGRPHCAKVCAGTTGRTTTNWSNVGTEGIYTVVDISGCGFVSVPTITTAMEGTSWHWLATGTSSVYSATATSFRIYVNKAQAYYTTHKYNIEWVAVGYTC